MKKREFEVREEEFREKKMRCWEIKNEEWILDNKAFEFRMTEPEMILVNTVKTLVARKAYLLERKKH